MAYIALDCFPILLNFELSEGTAIVEPLGASLWLLEYLLYNIDKNFNNRYTNANNTIDDEQNELKRKLAFTHKKITLRGVFARIGIFFSLIFIAFLFSLFMRRILLVSIYVEIPFFLSF